MAANNMSVFVTSCTGSTGHAVAKYCGAEPYAGRVGTVFLGCDHPEMFHAPADLAKLVAQGAKAPKVEVRTFDAQTEVHSVDKLAQMLAGVHAVAIVPPSRATSSDQRQRIVCNWIEAAQQAKVPRAVLVSWAGCDMAGLAAQGEGASAGSHLVSFKECERAFLSASQIEHKVVMRGSFYAQNLHLYAHQIINEHQLPLPTANSKWALLDADMFGRSIVHTLVCPDTIKKLDKQVLTMTGPEALSGQDIAAKLGEVIGAKVEFKDVSMQDAEKLIHAAPVKLEDAEIKCILEVYSLIHQGKYAWVTSDLPRVVGEEHVKTIGFKETMQRELPEMRRLAASCLKGTSSS